MLLALMNELSPIAIIVVQVSLLIGLILSIMEVCVLFTPKIITAALIHLMV